MITVELPREAYREMPFLNAAGGRSGGPVRERLPFFQGKIRGLPDGSPTLVAMGDLQGRTGMGSEASTLLGCGVAAALPSIQAEAGLPDPRLCVGILAGDLYAVPNAAKRGGTGDVSEVWRDLRQCFGSMVGVMGNHDIFGEAINPQAPPEDCLDGKVIEIGGLRIGGVSGIVGSPGRTNRRSVEEFVEVLLSVLVESPHIVVLHAAPQADDGAPGEEALSTAIKSFGFDGLIVCGHVHWRYRVQRCGSATVLNVDGAVVTLGTSD